MALDLNDKTSNGNNLTNVNAATEVTTNLPFAQSTSAVDFAIASSQCLYAVDSVSLSITGNLTIELWVKFTSLPASGATQVLVSKIGIGAPNWSYDFRFWNSAGTYRLLAQFSDDGTTGAGHLDSKFVDWTPSTGVWYHIALTYTAASSEYKFYVDGVQQGTTQTGVLTSIFNSTSRLEIGATNTGGTPQDPGDYKADDIRIWNVVRTQTQISDNRSIELTGSEANLQAYYPLETTLGTTTSTSTSSSTSTSTSTTSTSSSTSTSTSTTTSVSITTSTSITSTSTSTTSTSSSTSTSTSTSTTVTIPLHGEITTQHTPLHGEITTQHTPLHGEITKQHTPGALEFSVHKK